MSEHELKTAHFMAVMTCLEQASALIRRGLREVSALSGEDPDEFLPLHDLAAGLERLVKVALWCEHWVRERSPITTKELKGEFGHNIVVAVETVTNRCFPEDYLKSEAAQQDLAFLRDDDFLRRLLTLLADFGSGGRYFDLNVAGGTAEYGRELSPSDRLDDLAEVVHKERPELLASSLLGTAEGHRQVHDALQSRIRGVVERFTRAFARLFTLGPLRSIPHYPSHALTSFLLINDSDLGIRKY